MQVDPCKDGNASAFVPQRESLSTSTPYPDQEHLDTQSGRLDIGSRLVDQVRRCVADAKVPEPVGSDGQGHALGSESRGED